LLDPGRNEAAIGSLNGLDLLPVITTYTGRKTTHQVEATLLAGADFCSDANALTIKGYEIHSGQTEILDKAAGFLLIQSRSGKKVEIIDGAINQAGNVFGTHLHGLFDNREFLSSFINILRSKKGLAPLNEQQPDENKKQHQYDQLAETVRNALNMEMIYEIMGIKDV